MRAIHLCIAALLVLGGVACGSDQSSEESSQTIMPNVTGKKLDVAEKDLQRAGVDPDTIDIVGGGALGVVVKSNWTVCTQSPAAGQTVSSAPQLTIDRLCGTGSAAPSKTAAPSGSAPTKSPKSEPAPSSSPSEAALTAENSADFAAILVGDYCSPALEAFVGKYRGRNIEFDGSIAAMSKNGDYDTRYDILVAPGDKGPLSTLGPAFQFKNVNTTSDLHFTGSNLPASIAVGDKLHIIAQVSNYNSTQCLFFLTPVSTEIR